MTSVNPSLEELVITEEPKKSENVEKKEEMAIGLGELQVTDKIVIQQMSGLMNNCCCYEGENMFEISDRLGHVILRAKEDSSCCYRQCCERLRPFEITIRDRQSNIAIRITRPFRCDNCFCCPCINQVLEVECPPGNVIGHVEQNLNIYRPSFDICDANGDTKYVIEGPSSCKTSCRSCCGKCAFLILRRRRCCCFGRDIVFNITDAETGENCGDLAKLWAGPLEKQRGLADFDRFGIDFPDEAGVDMKVVLVASTFLIDYLYFEGDNGDSDDD